MIEAHQRKMAAAMVRAILHRRRPAIADMDRRADEWMGNQVERLFAEITDATLVSINDDELLRVLQLSEWGKRLIKRSYKRYGVDHLRTRPGRKMLIPKEHIAMVLHRYDRIGGRALAAELGINVNSLRGFVHRQRRRKERQPIGDTNDSEAA
jgi:hypothetical protein